MKHSVRGVHAHTKVNCRTASRHCPSPRHAQGEAAGATVSLDGTPTLARRNGSGAADLRIPFL